MGASPAFPACKASRFFQAITHHNKIMVGGRYHFRLKISRLSTTNLFLPTKCNILRRIPLNFLTHLKRNFCKTVREELTVQTFCDIHVKIPYNVKLKPLDVHKYHNCDLLKFELQGDSSRGSIKHIQDGNNIKIFSSLQDYNQDITCLIQAPIKANIHVTAQGDISAGVFNGSKLILNSNKGSIIVDKFSGDTIDLKTNEGDVLLKGAVVASKINIDVNTGYIKAKRLQGLSAFLRTKIGNITVDSSYCDNVIFETETGDLNLQNIHKNSKITQTGGTLNLTGLDGQIEAHLTNTNAEIQIAQILDNSSIKLENGNLRLLLSEDCQEKTSFEILTNEPNVDPTVKLIPSKTNRILYLTPMVENHKTVNVECQKGKVQISSASWINMLKLNMNK